MPTLPFLPRKLEFHDLFERGSANLVQAARALQNLFDNYTDVESQVAHITKLEEEGDTIVHHVFDLTYSSLIAPIDHEDAQELISALDNTLDTIEATAVRLLIFRIEQPTDAARRFAEMIHRGAEHLQLAMPYLRQRQQHANIQKHIVDINQLENEADQLLRDALMDLARRDDQLFDLIRWKEIYEHLESATDRIEDVGDVLLRVLIKNA